ncbi:MAG: Methionyl-tRNA formyltransferase [Ignavibacteria bacterium]|nr:Methionyl-tRNA formyltransferase [Ignavibacteria bacterium]
MGTPEIAVPSLELLNQEFGVTAIITVPDKPKGRGLQLIPSAIKIRAIELGLPVLQPENLKDESFISELSSYNPDIIVVVAFRILPVAVYSLAKLGTFNIHASLLPKYRGAAPINWAIINGEKETGMTSFLLQEKVDTGDILLQRKIQIPDWYTAGDLHDAMMPIAAELCIETCNLLLKGNYQTILQDNSLATPAPKLFRENCKIDWNKDAETVKNFIHGTSPFPGAWTLLNGSSLKILQAKLSNNRKLPIGTYRIEADSFYAGCRDYAIELIEIQPASKKVMQASEFSRGWRGATTGEFI